MEASEFEKFFRLMHPRLVRYAQRRVDPTTAEDLAAMALQTLWTKDVPGPRTGDAHRQLQSLTYRLLDGHLLNTYRVHGHHQRLLRRMWVDPAHNDSVADAADHVTASRWPEWALQLSRTDREVLGLIVDGYRVADIAIILNCKPSAITMRLRRAKARARALWAQEANQHD